MGFFGRVVVTLVLIISITTTWEAEAFNCSSSSSSSSSKTKTTCWALIEYVSPNSTTLSKIKNLFGVRKFQSLLGANNLPVSTSPDRGVAASERIKIPFPCLCSNGSGVSNRLPVYKVVPGDGLDHIARDIFSALVTYQQIQAANNITDPDKINVGDELRIPLPCSCDPVEEERVVHYGHVVAPGSTVDGIALQFNTSSTTLLNLNGLASPNDLMAGAVLDVPLKACKSRVANYSMDYPLLVANGTYVFTASGCVMCKCDAAANNWTLQCEQSNAQCPAVQCQGAQSLYIGNVTSTDCNRTTCAYAGYSNQTILTTPDVEPTCPGSQADHTVHMVRGSAATASSPGAATESTGSLNAAPAPGVTPSIGANEGGVGTGLGASLFPGLGFNPLGGTGASGLFGAGLPEFEQVQQQLTQNPNMMREIMNMPAIQNLMNNPDLMRSLVMNNPQMREIIDRNPPSILRQTLEAARNPELMREMMRNTDRAMSNIESSPEGFNMLRRMYENVQEPFLNATSMAGSTGNDVGSNPFAALLGNQGGGGGAQTRDGPNNTSSTGSETTAGPTAPNSNPLPNPWGSTGGGITTNSTTRSTPAGDARAPTIGGLGGLGLPGLDRLSGGILDPSMMNQVLQNPAMSQMMQSFLANPQYMNQILGMNPQLRAMLDLNPQLREMMQNPEFVRQLTSPATMQQMLAFQQSLGSQFNFPQPTQDPPQTGGTTGAQRNPGLEMMMNMFSGLGAGGLAVPNTPDVPPEQLYATQLAQLQEMGFFDTQENIRALRATSGNVHAAVERLLGNLGQ